MIFYAKGNEITVIGCPVTDERCRITIYPDAIIVEDKLINKKKIYYPQDNDEEFSIKVLEDRFNEIRACSHKKSIKNHSQHDNR